MAVSLPPEIIRLWRDRRHEEQRTLAEVMFDAIEANYQKLGELVAEFKPHVPKSSLFERPATRVGGEERASLQVHTSASNIKKLDELVEEFGADHRSQLIHAALDSYLRQERITPLPVR